MLLIGGKIQTGDPTGTGAGGESYWGTPFRDEHDMKGAAKHDARGVVAMANKGAGTNGYSHTIMETDTSLTLFIVLNST
jgi:peptidyl-prolyl cis-trans isomerase-like protein 2